MSSHSAIMNICYADSNERRLLSSADRLFVDSLASQSLETVLALPANLQSSQDEISRDLHKLCLDSSDVFLNASSALENTQTKLAEMNNAVDDILAGLDVLQHDAKSFEHVAEEILRQRAQTASMVQHQEKLLDLLDLPSLTASCVRAELYQEALNLATHADQLCEQFPDSQIVRHLRTEVRHEQSKMYLQLISQLVDDGKLANFTKALNMLRKAQILDDSELRLLFLSARLQSFDLKSAALDRSDGVQYVNSYVDHFREGVYDIITQYGAICSVLDAPANSDTVKKDVSKKEVESASLLLTSLCYHLVDSMMDILNENLPAILKTDQNALVPIMTRLGYCAASFARVGLDFSDIVCDVLENLFKNAGLSRVISSDQLEAEL